jgi:ABC-type uncharacterized transport system substrate-binding protein
MKRRAFITLVGGAFASPLVARAQQPAKMKRIATVAASDTVFKKLASMDRSNRAFDEELAHLGFAEGKNFVFERYSAGGQPDRYDQLARDVVSTHPDIIYPLESSIALPFKAATTTIPIVTFSSDPVALGLISNIARPGGNVTGTGINAGLEIWGKRIGLLKEFLPKLSNICVFALTGKVWEGPIGSAVRQAAKEASILVKAAVFEGNFDEAEYRRGFAAFEKDRPDALIVSEHPLHLANAAKIIELVARYRLPAMYAWREFVEAGGLMSYSPDLAELGRSIANQIGQILNGMKPGDIPFNLVSRYELALNLKTTKSLGIEFPATLLGSADFIIE